MSYAVLNLIGDMLFQLFGHGYIMVLFVTAVILLILIAVKAPLVTYFICIVPMFLGFVVNEASTNIINLPTWIYIFAFVLLGIVFGIGGIIALLR